MTEAEHSALIKRAQSGDARAFEELVNLYYGIMYKMAYKYVLNRETAEDITQDACIKLARGLNSFTFQSKFTSWLYRLVINAARDHIKSQARHPENPDALETLAVKAEGEDAVYTLEVLKAIYQLPAGEREALMLVLNDGYTHAEAGDILGVKEGTISWRISEAKKKLSGQFKQEAVHG